MTLTAPARIVGRLSLLVALTVTAMAMTCPPAPSQSPPIDYATHLGGNSLDSMEAVAVDAQGFIYVLGSTFSTDLTPTTSFGDTTTNSNKKVAFLAKLNPQATGSKGSSLVFLSVFAATASVQATDMALDPTGSAVFITGWVDGPGFPVKTLNTNLNSYHGGGDAFVACVDSATGASLNYSVLIGGTGGDAGLRMTVDSQGNAHLSGLKEEDGSNSIGGDPNTRTFGPRGGDDVFVLTLNPTGSQVLASALIGGAYDEWSEAMTVDANGNTYLGGSTKNDPANSAGWFPTTPDALKRDPVAPSGRGGGNGRKTSEPTTVSDPFFLRLDPSYQSLEYSTLLFGGVRDIKVANARAYLTGGTSSEQLPVVYPMIDASIGLTGDKLSGSRDAYLMVFDFTAFDPGQTPPTLAFASYLGGDTQDHGKRLHLGSGGRIFLLGGTRDEPKRTGKNPQKEYPQKGTPLYKSGQDFRDCFLTVLDPAGSSYAVVYSTLFGGNDMDNVGDFALGAGGQVHLLWQTQSTDLDSLVTPNAWLATKPTFWSGFLMRIPNPVASN